MRSSDSWRSSSRSSSGSRWCARILVAGGALAAAGLGCKTTHGGSEATGGAGVLPDGGQSGHGDGQAGGTGGAATGAGGSGGTGAGGSGITGAGGGAAAGAAGNPCTTAIFCDDFEKYAAGTVPTTPWRASTNLGAVAVDTTQSRSGAKSVKLTTQQRTTDGIKTAFIELTGSAIFPVTGNVLYGRMMFRLEAAPATSVHWTFIQGAGVVPGAGYHALYRYGGQLPIMQGATFVGSQLMANYDTPDSYAGTPPQSDCWLHANKVVVPVGRWACAEWKLDGATNQMSFSLDGAPVPSLSMTGVGQGCVHQTTPFTWTAPTFDRLSLGWESYQTDGARTIYLDDVVVSRTPIGCPAP